MTNAKRLEHLLSITRRGEGGCLVWAGCLTDSGYPRVWTGKRHLGRRFLVELMRGRAVPKGYVVTATCGKRACVAPEHLRVVLHSANQAQRITNKPADVRIRMTAARRARAKLDMDKAREMRRRAAEGETATSLARHFGVSLRTACCVIAGRFYRETAAWIPL
ncbi:MAG: HNH endonuclease [Burkholderiaceae bacterium]|jgi:hypothetical protein|nr:HNH endonuclease [Burkholderiaceae bacterium]